MPISNQADIGSLLGIPTLIAPQFNISAVGLGNGVLGLAGTTSGTATFTAPAVAGTTTNAVVGSNVLLVPVGASGTPSLQLGTAAAGLFLGGGFVTTVVGSTNILCVRQGPNVANVGNAGIFGWTVTVDPAGTVDTGISRVSAGVMALGNGAAGDFTGTLKTTIVNAVTGFQVNGAATLGNILRGDGTNFVSAAPSTVFDYGKATATSQGMNLN